MKIRANTNEYKAAFLPPLSIGDTIKNNKNRDSHVCKKDATWAVNEKPKREPTVSITAEAEKDRIIKDMTMVDSLVVILKDQH